MYRKKKFAPVVFDSLYTLDSAVSKRIFGGKALQMGVGDDFLPVSFLRLKLLRAFIFLAVLLLLLKLFQLSVIDGGKNRALAEENRVRLISVAAARGKILDRSGQVLASSENGYFLQKDGKETQISEQQAIELEKEGLAGEDFTGDLGRINETTVRAYPLGSITSHVTGYTSQVQKQDTVDNLQLESTDFVGRMGIEENYDAILRGVNGKKIIEVDSAGKRISILGNQDPKGGHDIVLTLDANLQKVTFEALSAEINKINAKAGAAIVSNPKTGEILALVSYPSFDQNDVGRALVDDNKPLFNRAIAGSYPPGSIFKIVSALSGLVSGKISPNDVVDDTGEFTFAGTKFANWYFLTYGGRDGSVNLLKAITRSNDIYFFKLGQTVGLEPIVSMARKLGFGQKTGIDIGGEVFGLVPDDVWKKSSLGEDWYVGDTMHLAIGQGFMVATPVQINRLTDFMANGGSLVVPHLVSRVVSSDSNSLEIAPKPTDLGVNSADISLVREGMKLACETGGTGWPFFDSKYKVGCKTGTAEKLEGDPHAWFTAFAPFDNPQLAVTVIVENGGEGSSIAGPIAKNILDWYFANHK